ncbi:MAG TPA: hypothetical protein VG944_00580 [Fimbriimonas sp.]|nr:hypothetical protein [Fimbriimonas sp.]
MPYEVFKRQRVPRAQDPYVTIHRRGTIALNTPAWEALGSPAAVELLFDRESNVMALRPVNKGAAHAYRLRQNGTSASSYVLSGTAFFQYYGIPLLTEARRLAAQVEDGMVVVDLAQEGEAAHPPRPPSKTRAKHFPKPMKDL